MATKFITVSIEIMHDKNLNQSQKFILAEIEQLSQLDNGCYASNKHFSDLIGITKENVSRNINDLQKMGYINIENLTDEKAYKILNKSNSKKGCLFCGYNGIAIDQHHYPIRNKDNGKKTINLCSNCHREFHHITDNNRSNIIVNWEKIGTTKEEYIKMIQESENGII